MPDRNLDAGTVSSLVERQFPALHGKPIARLGAGWDHELYSVGETWILRFPKRAERVPWLLREPTIVQLAGEALGPMVPCFELLGEPDSTYPYPFVGYRRLIGVGADQTGRIASALPRDIGHALSQLHRISIDRVPPSPGGPRADSWVQFGLELQSVAELVRPLLGQSVLDRAQPHLTGRITPPARRGPRRAIHKDICPDHLIVDPRSGRLTGLIDFSEAVVGDPVLDMVGLIGLGGYSFIGDVVSAYDLELGEDFADSLVWLARTLTLCWLADAAIHDPAGIPKHLRWVAAAFADPPADLA